ncbi:hypothetical protein J6590_004997 [Homalodisca vitripennis]|nr:hypothetical protein J6590_004997 [Homalodisca vitripennis]
MSLLVSAGERNTLDCLCLQPSDTMQQSIAHNTTVSLCYCERTNIVGSMAATIPTITLNNGRNMPAVGLGTWQRTNIVGSMAATIPTITLNNGRHMPAVGLSTWQYGGYYSYNHTEQWTPYARCWSGHLAGMYVYLFVSLNQLICVTVREQTLLALWRLLFLQSH